MESAETPSVESTAQILKQLALDEIELDPVTDVRPGPVPKDEAAKIDALAKSMYEQGQAQPIVVRPGENGKYKLIAGRRRLAAKKLIADKTGEPVTIDSLIRESSDDEAWSLSIQENLQRRQFSPIELAQNIMDVKKRKGLDGEDWTKHVAEFLHVSRATVSQHAKLLELPADIRMKVHKGDLSAQSAFDLYAVDEGKREQVLKDAEKLADKEAKESKSRVNGNGNGNGKSEAGESEEKGKVKRKHVLDAARANDALAQYKPRTRNELIGFFEEILESTDPYPEAIQQFASTFVKKWATGQVGDKSLRNKLDAISEMIEKPAKGRAAKKVA